MPGKGSKPNQAQGRPYYVPLCPGRHCKIKCWLLCPGRPLYVIAIGKDAQTVKVDP